MEGKMQLMKTTSSQEGEDRERQEGNGEKIETRSPLRENAAKANLTNKRLGTFFVALHRAGRDRVM